MNSIALVNLLQILVTLEPAIQNAVLALVKKLDGKTTEDALNEADAIWGQVLADAQAGGGTPTAT